MTSTRLPSRAESVASTPVSSAPRQASRSTRLVQGVIVAIIVLGALALALPHVRERVSHVLFATNPRPSMSIGGDAQPDGAVGEPGKLYRWRAADGVVHIESRPPTDDSEYEVISYVVERAATDDAPASRAEQSPAPPRSREPLFDSPFDVYSPEGMKKLMNRVDETARQLDERRQLLEELQDNM